MKAITIAIFSLFAIKFAIAGTLIEVAVTPEAKTRPEVASTITGAIFSAKEGDSVTVFDVASGRRAATIPISAEVGNAPNTNAKTIWLNKQQSAQLAALKAYLTSPGTSTGSGDFVRWIRSLELRKNEMLGATVKGVYFGSPLITNPEAYSMVNRWPSDGFVLMPESLYSAVGKERSLQDVEIHVVHTPGLTEFSERNRDFHAQKIKTFYGRMIARMGGNLASFSGTANHLSAVAGTKFPKHNYGDLEGGSKPVVYEVMSPQLVKEDGAREQSLWATPIEKNPLAVPQGPQRFDLGLTWDQKVDLDIYVQPDTDTELSFRQTSSKKYAGRFLKDILTTPENRGYETVVYENPVPLNTLKVFVNHYAGSSSVPINAEFRIRVNGQVYFKKFRLPAGQGTSGGGDRRANPSWVEIKVPALLGLG